ncbi:hypothetical protein STEG23_026144 [Scotinomys teguina]
MKECSVKTETRVSEIQIEPKEEKGPEAVSPQEERQEGKTAALCFKRRKKSNRMKPNAGSKAAEVTKKRPPEAGDSDQPQPGGTWASIKRLVTPRKRSESSKKQKPSEAEVQPQDMALPKKKTKARLKIPCIRFSRGEKRRHPSKLTEDSDYNSRVQGRADDLKIKAQTQQADQAIQAKSTQGRQEGVLVEDGKGSQESHVSNSVTSGENVVAVDLELESGSSAVQMGTPVLEKKPEVSKEKQSIQAQQASPLESSEADSPRPVASEAPAAPATAYQRSVEEPSDGIQESAPSAEKDKSSQNAAKKKKSGEMTLGLEEETTVARAEEAADRQTDKSAVCQAEEGRRNRSDPGRRNCSDPRRRNRSDPRRRNRSDRRRNRSGPGRKPQAQDAVTQADETAVTHADETAVTHTDETAVAQAHKTAVTQADETAVAQAHKTAVTLGEETAVTLGEEIAVTLGEEVAVTLEEEAAVTLGEEAAVTLEEEVAVTQAEDALSQAPDLKENGIDTEKPRLEESKRMEPIAIIITDTEISEFDVKKSKNVPKQFLISMENEQVGVFANDSDFEGRTSEQYETLLLETASSLVKNAIQLSVEQLVNEMVSEDNKINTL